MKKRVLVTGGAGFIGSHLVQRLLAEDCTVLVLDDLSSGSREVVAEAATLVVGDVRDKKLLNELCEGCQYVFHMGAFVNLPGSFVRRDECISINVDGTRCVLEAALEQGVQKVVFSSTSALYPDQPIGPKREQGPVATESPYAESKWAGEQLVRQYRDKGLEGVALRYFNVFGPGQPADSDYAAVIPLFIDRAIKGDRLSICGDGTQTRDFVYVEDVAGANWRAVRCPVQGVFNVGTGLDVSILDLANRICKAIGREQEYRYIKLRQGDALSQKAQTEQTQRDLGWSAQWGLDDGLQKTIEWWQLSEGESVHG